MSKNTIFEGRHIPIASGPGTEPLYVITMPTHHYFEAQNPTHHEILFLVHDAILNSHPAVQSVIKYGVPFYVLKKNLCYLCIQKDKPVLGIVEGYRLESIHDLLDFTGRKQIGHFPLSDMDEKRYNDLLRVIETAVDFDLKR